MNRWIGLVILWSFLASCNGEQGDIITLDSEAAQSVPYLVITGQDTNHRGIAFYTVDGIFVSGGNFRAENGTPRGLVPFNSTSVLVSLETTDSIFQVDRDGTKTLFHGSAQFSGNIYDIVQAPSGKVYVVESNQIEVFDENGVRLNLELINTTTGGCTLNAPRGMTLNANNQLVVVNSGGADVVLTYDLSGPTATCVSSVAFGNNPYGIVQHSDGFLYITTQNDNRVYRADPDGSNPVVIWDTDTALINNPTGIVEHPSGDLLVASSGTDTVERITTSGVRVGSLPFIEDTQSLNISDMTIIGDTSNGH